MKKLVFIICLLISVNSVRADFFTPGTGKSWTLDSLVANSGGSVTFSGGAYYLNDDTLTISKYDTLKIFNNATLYFSSLSMLYVKGTLLVNPPDSVRFTVADTTTKYKMLFLDSTSTTVLRKLIFEYANCIRISDCSPTLDSCIIRNNIYYATGMQRAAVALFRSNATITNCKFYNNFNSAINGGANIANSPKIINCLFYGNNIANGNYPQINMGSGAPETFIIRGNVFLRASTNSGAIGFLPTGGIPSLLIENNIIKNNRFGIGFLAGGINAIVRNNVIDSCNTQGNPSLGGSGINFAGGWSSSSVIATRNVIRWNLWGITIQNTAKPNLGNVDNADTSDNGMNVIYGNGNTGKTYDLYNNTVDSIRAQNNYWGTVIPDSIEAHIFHKADTSSLGWVNFIPFMFPTSVTNPPTVVNNYEYIEVYPSPFNPSTNIRFKINQAGIITLKIYDILGREVSNLFNEYMNQGVYEKQWNSSNLASGIYIVRLITNQNSYAKKVAIVK